jgi:DNA-binding MarR family transcriptional regulator
MKLSTADETWRLLLECYLAQRPRVPAVAHQYNLSPVQVHVLSLLEPGSPQPMHAIAEKLACDASNVTGIIDRMEQRDLVQRVDNPDDGRVKMLSLTKRGRTTRENVLADLYRAPERVAALSKTEHQQLQALLRKSLSREG